MFPDSLAGRRVLILGASYREDVGDTRHSPSLALAEMLAEKRAAVEFADPLVDAEIACRCIAICPLPMASTR